jgi:hypothetical protein
MHLLPLILGRIFLLSIAAIVAGIVACFVRRWRLALTLSRAATFMGFATLVAWVIAIASLPSTIGADVDQSTRVTLLSLGVSELVNWGALTSSPVIPAAILWLVARSRLKRGA